MNFEMPPRSIPTKPDTLGPPPCPDHGKASASGTVIRSPLSHEVAVWCSLGRNENRSPVEASKISVFQLIWTIDILTSHQVIQWTTKTGIHIHNYHVFIIFDMICIYPISQANVFKLNLHIVYIYIYIEIHTVYEWWKLICIAPLFATIRSCWATEQPSPEAIFGGDGNPSGVYVDVSQRIRNICVHNIYICHDSDNETDIDHTLI